MAETNIPHCLTLRERRELTMTGVTEVVSFEETAVVLHTALGTLTVQGSGLQLKTLSLEGGQVAVDGCSDDRSCPCWRPVRRRMRPGDAAGDLV